MPRVFQSSRAVRRADRRSLLAVLLVAASGASSAADVVVRVSGLGPRFDEASFKVAADAQDVAIDIKVAK